LKGKRKELAETLKKYTGKWDDEGKKVSNLMGGVWHM
jgi:hypothetical protein